MADSCFEALRLPNEHDAAGWLHTFVRAVKVCCQCWVLLAHHFKKVGYLHPLLAPSMRPVPSLRVCLLITTECST
jgi:hypothetical protein